MNTKKRYIIDIDTLKVSIHPDGSQFNRGGIARGNTTLITEYGGWHKQPTGMEEGIRNIREGTELSGFAKRTLMVIAIHRVMEKRGMNPGLSAATICDKSIIPVTGFTGMYVYFKLGLRKDRVDTHQFTINHDLVKEWEVARDTYKKMSKEIDYIPKLIENINKEYQKVKAKAKRMMFKNRYNDEVAVAG